MSTGQNQLESRLFLEKLAKESREADRAFGSVFGAFTGDAAGAVLEFYDGRIEEWNVEQALQFGGGGSLYMGAGQITDDSEMAMCIMHGLTDPECAVDQQQLPKTLNLDGITYYYGKWSKNAFDIGLATRAALGVITNVEEKKHKYTIQVFKRAVKKNYDSQSNGTIMRITPQIVWGRHLTDEDFYNAIRLQTNITHSNHVVVEATYLYAFAIRLMILNPELTGTEVYDSIKTLCYQRMRNTKHENYVAITDWFDEMDQGILPNAEISMGWIKIAFNYAFHILKNCDRENPKAFEHAMKQMLREGGDTDTNAAIVGGLIGAYVGYSKIPQSYKDAVLNFDSETMIGNKVQSYLLPKHHLCSKLIQIYQNYPTKLQVQLDQELIISNEDIKKLVKKPEIWKDEQNAKGGLFGFQNIFKMEQANIFQKSYSPQIQASSIAIERPHLHQVNPFIFRKPQFNFSQTKQKWLGLGFTIGAVVITFPLMKKYL